MVSCHRRSIKTLELSELTVPHSKKVVLNSTSGNFDALKNLVPAFIADRVELVAAMGFEAARVEDIVDDLCKGDGSRPYFLLTTSHPGESLVDVLEFISSTSWEIDGPVEVVEF